MAFVPERHRTKLLIVIAFFLIFNVIENYLITPKVFGLSTSVFPPDRITLPIK